MSKSSISWCDETWGVVVGCNHVSPGCEHCWAERLAATRLKHLPAYQGLAVMEGGEPRWTGVRCNKAVLMEPLGWRRPRKVFVAPMGDLYHKAVPREFIRDVYSMMEMCQQHTFQILTKRPERMEEFHLSRYGISRQPIANIWYGFSAENQDTFEDRWQQVRPLAELGWNTWVSLEPLLGPVTLPEDFLRLARWCVVGGESGPKARPMHPDWPRMLRDHCHTAGVPYYFKQFGAWVVASAENGILGSVMPETGNKFTWMGIGGKTQNPSSHGLVGEVYAMAKLGKKRAGRVLDGREWNEFPQEASDGHKG